MRFSIIIPLYNKAAYIKETLHSLAVQSKLPYELIIVDDKSTDDSLQIVKDYLKLAPICFKRIRVELIELKKNYGIGYARNIGFSKATGDIVSFLDADDIYKENLIETAINVMSLHTINFLVLGIELFPSNRVYPKIDKLKKELTLIKPNVYRINNPLKLITSHNFYLLGSNVVLKKTYGESIKYIEEPIIYEGIDYWYRVLKKMIIKERNTVGLLMGEFLKVREVPGSASRKKYNHWKEIDYPPVLTRFKNSKEYYDKRLKGVVSKRWINHAMSSLNSLSQKIKFIIRYRKIFLNQIHYFFLHKF